MKANNNMINEEDLKIPSYHWKGRAQENPHKNFKWSDWNHPPKPGFAYTMKMKEQQIADYLVGIGDLMHYRLRCANLNLRTHAGIDKFFLKLDEFVDEHTETFDLNAYLKVNSFMLDFYWNDPGNLMFMNKSLSYGDLLHANLTHSIKPSYEHLLSYLSISNEVLTSVIEEINTNANLPSVANLAVPVLAADGEPAFMPFEEKEVSPIIDRTKNLSSSFINYDDAFRDKEALFRSWLLETDTAEGFSSIENFNIVWKQLILSSIDEEASDFIVNEQHWWIYLIITLQGTDIVNDSIFFRDLIFLDEYLARFEN